MKRVVTWVAMGMTLGGVAGVGDGRAATFEVSSYDALKTALERAAPGDVLEIRDGQYGIPATDFALVVATPGLTVRGASRDASRVILEGRGMEAASPAHVFYVKADDFTLEHVTLRRVRRHLVQVEGAAAGSVDGDGADRLRVRDCVFQDAGEQMLKGSSDGMSAADEGWVQRCRFEYTAGVGPRFYIGGIDVHRARGWRVEDCEFRGIRSPEEALAEHAVHFWSGASDTVVRRNRIRNCDRGIGFGLGDRGHQGGVIENNVLWNDGLGRHEDVGIGLESSPGTQVRHNTIWLARYPNAVEWRYPTSRGVRVVNNLSNRAFSARDGAVAEVAHNVGVAEAGWFRDVALGDLRLAAPVAAVVDRGGSDVGDPVAEDGWGSPRPVGAGWDVGAEEWRPGTRTGR